MDNYIYWCENCERLLTRYDLEYDVILEEIRYPNDLARQAEYSEPYCEHCKNKNLTPVEKKYLSKEEELNITDSLLFDENDNPIEIFFNEERQQFFYYVAEE